MSQDPDLLGKVELSLRSSPALSTSFLGKDHRPVAEIIAADAATLARLGITATDLAKRMQGLAAIARQNLEVPVVVGRIEVYCQQWKGRIGCPWPGCGLFDKTVTVARHLDKGIAASWTDLNMHLIAEHGFFEGIGSPFRVEPQVLVQLLA
ncbi:MAG: hypothetical protein QHH07_02720 [Sedimentisphaerales bacterium]|jgi:hypothetical protein|nr:hypothetical protein [Sedimentisphaerales bacterium]